MSAASPTPDARLLSAAIARVDAHLLRMPIAEPVRTSFGTMHARPAVFVRVEDADGAHGWGEVWCNFPACGAEHRARLVETVVAPLLVDARFATPADAWVHLDAATAVLALQSGEPGPIAQAIAGVDLALWDLAARRRGVPLWRLLGGTGDAVPVYASGINPDAPDEVIARARADGHRAFKLKIGFGAARDHAALRRARDAAAADPLMADANQAWSLADALAAVATLAPYALAWLEEPLRADRPAHEWRTLAAAAPAPLAAGENVAGTAAFDALLAERVVGVVQPDVAKWGGLSAVLPIARRALAAQRRFCPHYLGAGIGLLHSAHLLAAVGGDGRLEVDANDNPLRTLTCGPLAAIRDGFARLGAAPGIGVEPDLQALRDACQRAGARGGRGDGTASSASAG